MNAAALANPETVKAFAALIELLANPHEHKHAVQELKALVEELHKALTNAQNTQAKADAQVQESARLMRAAEDVKARNDRDLADIAVRRKQLDDHAEVLAKRQADLEENERRSQEEFDGREKKMVQRERETHGRGEAMEKREAAARTWESALQEREAGVAAAEARLREVLGVTRSFTLEAETGRPLAQMGGG